MIRTPFDQIIKKITFRTTLFNEISRPKYEFNLSPVQLCRLCKAISDTRSSNRRPGCIVEVGVARGMTTTFLLKHMELEGDRRNYYCVDTFEGFTKEDIEHEVERRGKKKTDYGGFSYNDIRAFQKNLNKNGFENAVAVGADVNSFDFLALAPIDVLLVDVDLYRPTLSALKGSYRHLNDDAFVMVDDVVVESIYDGARDAYHEFVRMNALPAVIFGNRCGLILKREQS